MSTTLFPGRRVMWMPLDAPWKPPSGAVQFCCEAMSQSIAFSCDQHSDPFDCADHVTIYNEIFDEHGLVIHDGGPGYVLIEHCPWCGTKLPESQRDRWFDETEALADATDLPSKYYSGEWRRG